jgi:hypothetical protein
MARATPAKETYTMSTSILPPPPVTPPPVDPPPFPPYPRPSYSYGPPNAARATYGGPGPVLTTIGAALIAVSVFLPWVTVSSTYEASVTKVGFEGPDGIWFLLLGALIGAIGLARRNARQHVVVIQLLALPPAGFAGWAAVADANHMLAYIASVHSNYPQLGGFVGFGPSVVVLGAVAAVVGALIPNSARVAS